MNNAMNKANMIAALMAARNKAPKQPTPGSLSPQALAPKLPQPAVRPNVDLRAPLQQAGQGMMGGQRPAANNTLLNDLKAPLANAGGAPGADQNLADRNNAFMAGQGPMVGGIMNGVKLPQPGMKLPQPGLQQKPRWAPPSMQGPTQAPAMGGTKIPLSKLLANRIK